jgi:energy-coupling factor transporter ATP-binding protein EcfA2
MGSGDAYDVFLSYAHSDGAAAAELNGWLIAQGLSTFFDRRELRPGLRWVPALEDAIGRSKAAAILVGKHGIGNTQQYERELALIRQTGDPAFPVIPVLMPDCDSPPTGFLQLLTWVDLSKGTNVLQQTDSLAALRAAVRREPIAASPIRASICPYRGLEPFREEDAAFFCGRDDAIRELVSRVQAHNFVAVVGPSGSGKSSLVFAGLLPALRKQGRTTMWDVVDFRPGKSPLHALAEAFGTGPEIAGPAEIDARLEKEVAFYRAGDADMLARMVDRRLAAAPEKPDRLLIYVDQWEELYAMAPAPEDKGRLNQHSADVERFIELLIAASSGARSRARVVLTVRADFYNQLIQGAPIDALLPKQQVNIPAMRRDDLKAAVETPAKIAGLSFDPPKLVDQILNDVGLEEGRLPLLQFALKETWQERESDKLTAKAYTAVGGVAGAIEKTAQDSYERLAPAALKDAARRLFLSLVTPGEGQADTRARSLIPDDPQQREIINLFASPKTRLLVTGYEIPQGAARPGSEPRSTVEVAHEALIQRWGTLRDWVSANRQKLRDRSAILRAKAEWEEQGRDEKFLLDPGVQLERGRALLDDPGDVRVDDISRYVGRSMEREDDRLAAERAKDDAQRQKELADQKRIGNAERQAREAAEQAASEAKARAEAEGHAREAADEAARQADAREEAQRQAREAAEETASHASAREMAETQLRTTAEQKASVEQTARKDAEAAARKLRQSLIYAAGAAVVAVTAFLYSLYEAGQVSQQAEETQHQLDRANQALAESINNDLGVGSNGLLTARQRRALWKLALADGAVKGDFLSLLASSPEETARASPGFAQISRAVGVLRPTLTEAQALAEAAQKALSQANSDVEDLLAVIKALKAKVGRMEIADPRYETFSRLAEMGQRLRAGLTEAQYQLVAPSLKPIDNADPIIAEALDPFGIRAPKGPLANYFDASLSVTMAAATAEAATRETLDALVLDVDQAADPKSLLAFAQALRVLTPMLSESQATRAVDPVIRQIRKTPDPTRLEALVDTLEGLAPSMTEGQAQSALDQLLDELSESSDPYALRASALTIEALLYKIAGAQVQGARQQVLRILAQRTDPDSRQALVQTYQALSAKIDEAQVEKELGSALGENGGNASAMDALLQRAGRETNPYAIRALAQRLQPLAANMTAMQAQQALDAILKQITQTTDPRVLRALAQTLQALAPRLSEDQSRRAFDIAKRSLAWAASADDAAGWARAYVALSSHLADQGSRPLLVAAVAYPAAAGSATEILLEAIRRENRDAPPKEAGTDSTLEWLAEKYPWLLDPPTRPDPPQSFDTLGVQCPSQPQ